MDVIVGAVDKLKNRCRLTFSVEVELAGEAFTSAVSEVRFTRRARETEVGDRLVKLALRCLEQYREHRWREWDDAEPAA